MDIKQLNNRYFLQREKRDSFLEGLSSSLIAYRNGIMLIKVFINSDWEKSYQVAAYEVAHAWKNSLPELRNVIGCKVFIYDLHKQANSSKFLEYGSTIQVHAKKGILFQQNQLN